MTSNREKKAARKQQLLEAARLGDYQQLELVLNQLRQLRAKKKANPLASLRKLAGPDSVRDPVTGFTCLHHAALNGHSSCVRLILAEGANVNAVDYKGSSALHLAAWAGNLDSVRALLLAAAGSRPELPEAAAAAATDEGARQRAAAADLNLLNNDNQTPLSLAAQFGHHQVVGELLKRGAQAHLRNSQLMSPLELACLHGRLETADLLLASSPRLQQELRRPRATLEVECRQQVVPESPPTVAATSNATEETSPSSPAHRRSSGGWSALLGRAGRGSDPKQPASPLQRLTAGTLSMRQRSPQKVATGGGGELSHNRRATLTVGALPPAAGRAHQQQPPPHKQLSADGWLGGGNSKPEVEERLLEHSPLHLAVRRGHRALVALLLNKWRANPLQVTTLGGLLHECALANAGKPTTDMASQLLEDLALEAQQQPQSSELLERFLALRDAQQRTVFDLLNELNNRWAQELKRLIYEASERAQRHLQQQQENVYLGDLGSFVTLKRGAHARQPLAQLNQQQQHQFAMMGTQTIDRRKPLESQQQQQQQQRAPLGEPLGQLMTRSVSNLQSQPTTALNHHHHQWPPYQNHHHQCQQPADMQKQQQRHHYHQNYHNNQWQQQPPVDPAARSRRSKSRDLGSLLLEAQQQRQQQQHQQQEAQMDSSSSSSSTSWLARQQQLVRSQTDCSHLMGRFFGPPAPAPSPLDQQQQPSQADRKAINRHYHVYEHEFYPPRLLGSNTTAAAPTSSSLEQPVAVVPPFARATQQPPQPQEGASHLRASFIGCQPTQQQLQQPQHHHHHNSRLSLNVGTEPSAAQMDRFLARHSRQAPTNLGPSSLDLQQQQQQQQQQLQLRRHELVQLQGKLLAEHQQQQLQLLPNSLSLESHLSEPHLFESTRRAIQQDFDQMIGRELLNRCHRQIIDGSLQQVAAAPPLTAVSLDMDARGERLTVSGTRLVAAQPPLVKPPPPQRPPDANKSAQTSPCKPVSPPVASAACQTEEQDDDDDLYPRQPPPKPPRLSLLGANVVRTRTEPPKARPPPIPPAPVGHPAASGLLKMAPISVSTGQRRPQMAAAATVAAAADDSGVYTSHSPATSTSYEGSSDGPPSSTGGAPPSERQQPAAAARRSGAVVRHLTRTAPPPPHLPPPPPPPPAPPSPNTAQLCIEQALAQTKHDHSPSPTQAFNPIASLDRWLAAGGEAPPEADYENCRELQRQLRAAELLEAAHLFPSTSPDNDEDDDDHHRSHYTRCEPSDAGAVMLDEEEEDEEEDYAVSSSSKSAASSGSEAVGGSSASGSGLELATNSASKSPPLVGAKKEVLLKVVVDVDSEAREAQEASDEQDNVFYMNPSELQKIATKRSQADADTLTDEELCAAIDKDSGYIRFTLRKRRNTSQVDKSAQNNTATSQSDATVEAASSKKTKFNGVEREENPSDSGHQVQKDSNNNNNSPLVPFNEQSAAILKQWFATNLPGLIEYLGRFLANGMDNTLFLNHNHLMNESILEMIGIVDQSHGLLISERIQSELPPVDFNQLFCASVDSLSALKVLQILQMDHLEELHDEQDDGQSSWRRLLQMKSDGLPLGYKLRLQLALAHLESKQGELESASAKRLEQTQSNSSLDMMDTSQTSSTSSPSKESIKSVIVSQLVPPTRPPPPPPPQPIVANEAAGRPLQTNNVDHNQSMQQQSPPPPSAVDANGDKKQEPARPPPLRPPTSGGSLVSEAARRLEAVVVQRSELANAKAHLKPVAAARRLNNNNNQIAFKSLSDENSSPETTTTTVTSSPRKSFVPVKSICWPPQTSSTVKLNDGHQLAKELVTGEVAPKPIRPNKPTPPAKPAKLASKFGGTPLVHYQIESQNKPKVKE